MRATCSIAGNMDVLQEEKLWLFVFFALPGLLGIYAWEMLVPTPERKAPELVLRGITFSIVNTGLVWPFADLVPQSAPTWVVRIIAVAVLVSLPAAEAFGVRSLLESRWFRARGRLRHPVPTPWDHFFGRGQTCWVIMHLKSGAKVAGYFGTESFASSFPHPEQIYIQQVWVLDEQSERRFAHPAPRTQGAIVSLRDCDSVEFFTDEPEAK